MHDVAEAVQAIGAAVRKGEFQEATVIAGRCAVPLGVTAQQLQCGNLISTGAESSVYQGTYLGQRVAVKRPRIRTAADLDRFRRELCILTSLQHDSIIRVLAAKALPPDYSLVLPWYPKVANEQLHEHGWRPSWHAILTIAAQLATAVHHIHDQGVVHRDIKTGNLLLTEDEQRCVLIDFGIAAYIAEMDADLSMRSAMQVSSKPSGGFHKAHMVGTLEYMAPEVLQRRPHSTWSDVYALAVVVNELVTATVPFSDCTRDNPKAHTILDMGYGRQELAAAVCAEGLRPLTQDDTPPALLALLEACWQAEPTARPTAAQIAAAFNAMQESINDVQPARATLSLAGVAVYNGPPAAEHAPAVGVPPVLIGDMVNTVNADAADQPIPWPSTASYKPQVNVGFFATPGCRGVDKMEDTVVVASPLLQNTPHVHLLAVFDGHRGDAMAQYAQAHIAATVCRAASGGLGPADALTHAFVDMDRRFRDLEDLRWKARAAATHGDPGARPWPGATALTVLIVDDTLVCANAGDCRAVLCRSGLAVPMSRDHTAALEDERQRVEAMRGSVQWVVDGWRVGTAGLQVTRSLGDADLKGCGVIAQPEIIEVQLTPADKFVVLGSDGLWDKVSNQEVVDLVHDTVKQPAMCAQRLATEALARGGEDNVAVVVAFLQPVETTERIYADGQQKYHSHAESYVSTRRPGMRYSASGSMDEQLDTY